MNNLIRPGFILLCAFFACTARAQQKTYYISSAGNDSNDGFTQATAWRTISALNLIHLAPGDSVLFEGGSSFTGSIHLSSSDMGTPQSPIVISSYGTGKPTIDASGEDGLFAYNTAGIEISNLIFKNNGAAGNSSNGIHFYIDQTTAGLQHILLDKVDVYGFGGRGILINAGATDKGFDDITIQYCSVHDNGIAGIETQGNLPGYSHSNLHIRYCTVFTNQGQSSELNNATGNGILISGVNGGLVEYSEAYDNGQNNAGAIGGPAGFSTINAINITLQYCESYRNHAGATRNGDGFILNGGSHNCLIQYCYSHNNEGPGYAMTDFGSNDFYLDNAIRYNISQDDSRRNGYGALYFAGADSVNQITKSYVYNNTIYLSESGLIDGTPSAVMVDGVNMNGIKVRNNIFYVNGNLDVIRATENPGLLNIVFQNNDYYSPTNTARFAWSGNSFNSLASWRSFASGQEMSTGLPVGSSSDPLLYDAGNGETVHPASGGDLTSVAAYKIVINSAAIDAGMNMAAIGNHDYYGNNVPFNAIIDIGAFEYSGEIILPVRVLSFTGVNDHHQVWLRWKMAEEENVQRYEVMHSSDGKKFDLAGTVPPSGINDYTFTDPVQYPYYRLRVINKNGLATLSNILKIAGSRNPAFSLSGSGGADLKLSLISGQEKSLQLDIYDACGRLIFHTERKNLSNNETIIINGSRYWLRGMYFVRLNGNEQDVLKWVK